MTNQTMPPFAAAVYSADTGDRKALLKFVEKQRALHTRVGGVLRQVTMAGNHGTHTLLHSRIPQANSTWIDARFQASQIMKLLKSGLRSCDSVGP